MAIARWLSVTVSMAAESNGIPSSIDLVSLVRVLVLAGKTSDSAGSSKISSKVRPSRISIVYYRSYFDLAQHHTEKVYKAKLGIKSLGTVYNASDLAVSPRKFWATTNISADSGLLEGGLECRTLLNESFISLSRFFSVPP